MVWACASEAFLSAYPSAAAVKLGFRAPAAWPKLQHVTMMQQAIEAWH